ncbi:MAG: GNAT family N-acetyltransferase [Chloroflexi bacterium]|nr:GNAT family N-acetyltransferase [Chloroflexota bacterium]
MDPSSACLPPTRRNLAKPLLIRAAIRNSRGFWVPGPARVHSARASAAFYEKETDADSVRHFSFSIRSPADDRLLGETELEVNWAARDSFVGIGINDREDWGKGYGTDAMRIMLRYAFTELNLRRVTLTVFEYNPRAIRSYEKAGFRREGRMCGALLKDGKRWDILFMGIMFDEWKEPNDDKPAAS